LGLDEMPEAEAPLDDEEFGMDDDALADIDEVGTKLDLARAYIDMGDPDGARSILDEVMEEGNDDQKKEAQELLDKI
jgi:pilus assembly protein FimV